MWGSKIIKFQRREGKNSSTFNMRESIGSVRAAPLSPVRRTGAARFRQTRVFNFKKQRAPFRNFFPRIEVGVATRNLGLMALTVSEILAFEVLVQFFSLSNKLLKHSKRHLGGFHRWGEKGHMGAIVRRGVEI